MDLKFTIKGIMLDSNLTLNYQFFRETPKSIKFAAKVLQNYNCLSILYFSNFMRENGKTNVISRGTLA